MRKPATFKLELVLLATGGLFSALAMVFVGSSHSLVAKFLFVVGIVALTSGVLVHFVRQERQNQRVNRSSQNVAKSIKDMNRAAPLANLHMAQSAVDFKRSDSKDFGSNQIIRKNRERISDSMVETKYQILLDPSCAKSTNFSLQNSRFSFQLPIEDALEANITFRISSDNGFSGEKVGLATFSVFDENGQEIDHPLREIKSESYGYASYLTLNGRDSSQSVLLSLPRSARLLSVQIMPWEGQAVIQNEVLLGVFSINPNWKRIRNARDLKVACILDEFSYNSFKFECNLLPLSRKNWKAELDDFQPDFFFCESAWSGADSKERPWMGHVYASENFDYENRKELLGILSYCKDRNIPTVFWNKEDPSHFEDRKHDFVKTAALFDTVFTTDIECVDRYRNEYGLQNVDVLPFAVQPRLFNPINVGERSKEVVFAGSWYSNHVDRCRDMEEIFNVIESSGHRLKIYDRFYDSDDSSHDFPEAFQYAINPPVPNEEVAKVYKKSLFGLTINTETQSPTMFARRIFELMACNTLVLSNYSRGVEEFFGDNVFFLDKNPSALKELGEEDLDRIREENLTLVLSEHTYAQRFQTIARATGIEFNSDAEQVALVVCVSDLEVGHEVFDKLVRFSSWNGPKTILISDQVEPLKYADALTAWNLSGVRVVSEKLVFEGKTTVTQLTGNSNKSLVISERDFLKGILGSDLATRLKLHGQYTDLPVAAIEMVKSGQPKYYFGNDRVDYPILVGNVQLVGLLKEIKFNKQTVVYGV